MSSILGALIGGAIDGSDGDSPVEGMIVGAIAGTVIKKVVPLAIAAGGIWYAQRYVRRQWASFTAPAPTDPAL